MDMRTKVIGGIGKPFPQPNELVNMEAEIAELANATGANRAIPPPVAFPSPVIPEDNINPAHYRKHPSGIECIEVTRHMNFNIGNAIKYLWRYMDKGDPVENLKKAQWYIDDEIRRLGGK